MPEYRARRWPRVTARVLGVTGVAVGVLGVVARTVPVSWQPMVVVAAFFPLAAVVGFVGLLLLAAVRWWPGAAVGSAVVVWTVVVQVPLFVAATPADGVDLTVLQANLGVGGADPDTLVRQVQEHRVGLLTVDELTPEALDGLTRAGLDDLLPHRLAVTFPGGAGTGIWSAAPLESPEKIEDFSFELLGATITLPDARSVHVVAVHLLPPWPYPSRTWVDELDRLRTRLTARPGNVVASGDFNATLDHPQFRRLLAHGFHDASEQSGAGYRPTYPTDKHVPPFLTLDHVVTRGVDARSARTLDLPGSDHRALLVTLAVPRA